MGQVGSLLFGPSWENSRQVRVETGLVAGKTFTFENGKQIDAFLGIPFAKPPVGELRFKKPEPAEPWSGVRDCTNFGPRCPHEDVSIEKFTNFHTKSEDCLILNVFTPTVVDGLKPVMFFIHGGGFAMHSSMHYGDYGICKNLCTKDVVVVTIQYRLGFFGFLSTGDENCPGNMGLWDMTLALKWVNQNIREFGGDPNNVTVFGQSAGGASTDYLSLSPHSNKLFHKFAPMSGTSLCSFAMNDSAHIRDVSWNFALQQGFIAPKDASKFEQSRALVEFMRNLPPADIEIGMLGRFGVNEGGRLDLTPVFDGDFFPKPFAELRKLAPPKPLMTGITEVEGLLFTAIKPPRGSFKEEIRRQIVFDFQKRKIHDAAREKAIFDMYLNEVQRNNRRQYVTACMTLISDMIINNGVWELADTAVRLQKGAPTYLYSFDYHNPDGFGLAGLIFPFKAATHCSELPYLFGKGIIALFRPSETDNKMVDFFTTLFTNFSKYGNPNGLKNPQGTWEPLTSDHPNRYYHIDVQGSEMRSQFCGGRPQKWRELLQPCDCGQRVCSKEGLEDLDQNNNDFEDRPFTKSDASAEVARFTLLEEALKLTALA